MKRRIKIGGKSAVASSTKIAEVKEIAVRRFDITAETADALIKFLRNSGLEREDVESIETQMRGKHTEALPAFLFHNEHVLDQLAINQGAYTNFMDTAAQPNFVLRHPGNSELTFRRITPGDLLMLEAAHVHTLSYGIDERPAESTEFYWQEIWDAIVTRILRHRADLRDGNRPNFRNGMTAMIHAMEFHHECSGTERSILVRTFCNPGSKYDTGVRLNFSRLREGDRFISAWEFVEVPDAESLFMAATIILCNAFDDIAKALLYKGHFSPTPSIYDMFPNWLVSRNEHPYYVDNTDGSISDLIYTPQQEAEYRAAQETHNDTAVNPNRLIP